MEQCRYEACNLGESAWLDAKHSICYVNETNYELDIVYRGEISARIKPLRLMSESGDEKLATVFRNKMYATADEDWRNNVQGSILDEIEEFFPDYPSATVFFKDDGGGKITAETWEDDDLEQPYAWKRDIEIISKYSCPFRIKFLR